MHVLLPILGVPPQPVNFSSYINGESVRNTDIVNWVTVGAYDVPTSESAPVTAVTGRELSFWLRPYNYFDRVRGNAALLLQSLLCLTAMTRPCIARCSFCSALCMGVYHVQHTSCLFCVYQGQRNCMPPALPVAFRLMCPCITFRYKLALGR